MLSKQRSHQIYPAIGPDCRNLLVYTLRPQHVEFLPGAGDT